MKPKTIDEILRAVNLNQIFGSYKYSLTEEEAKAKLLDLFMSCVPKRCEREIHDTPEEAAWADGVDFCRNWMIKNLEKLK